MESDNESETPPPERNIQRRPDQTDNATVIKGTFGRGKPKLIRERSGSSSPRNIPEKTDNSIGPLTITTTNMTDTEIHRAISDAKHAIEEFSVRDENGKVFNKNTSFLNTGEKNSFELDLASNLSSSTELETDVKNEEEKIVRRSKRLTKTQLSDIITQYVMITGNKNPIVRYNNPVCHDYGNHRRKADLERKTGSSRHGDKQPKLTLAANNKQTSRTDEYCDKNQCEDRLPVYKPVDHWRNHRHVEATQNPIAQSTANSGGGNVEDSDIV